MSEGEEFEVPFDAIRIRIVKSEILSEIVVIRPIIMNDGKEILELPESPRMMKGGIFDIKFNEKLFFTATSEEEE